MRGRERESEIQRLTETERDRETKRERDGKAHLYKDVTDCVL